MQAPPENCFILGNDDAAPRLESNPWEPGRYRSSHVYKFGGYRLRELASDNTDLVTHGATHEELDHMCRDIGKEDWLDEGEDVEMG